MPEPDLSFAEGFVEPSVFALFTKPDAATRWCVFDESGLPVGLTVKIAGVGDFVIPLVPKEDA